jgi:hypothetical protein
LNLQFNSTCFQEYLSRRHLQIPYLMVDLSLYHKGSSAFFDSEDVSFAIYPDAVPSNPDGKYSWPLGVHNQHGIIFNSNEFLDHTDVPAKRGIAPDPATRTYVNEIFVREIMNVMYEKVRIGAHQIPPSYAELPFTRDILLQSARFTGVISYLSHPELYAIKKALLHLDARRMDLLLAEEEVDGVAHRRVRRRIYDTMEILITAWSRYKQKIDIAEVAPQLFDAARGLQERGENYATPEFTAEGTSSPSLRAAMRRSEHEQRIIIDELDRSPRSSPLSIEGTPPVQLSPLRRGSPEGVENLSRSLRDLSSSDVRRVRHSDISSDSVRLKFSPCKRCKSLCDL